MSEDLYEVRVDGIPYATDISLEAAMVMVESLFRKWFAEPNLAFEIRKITKATNADRIRNMTDEELASVITDDWCEIVCSGTDYLCNGGTCEQHVLKWLKEDAVET